MLVGVGLGSGVEVGMDVGWKGVAWTLKEGDGVGGWLEGWAVSKSVCCW